MPNDFLITKIESSAEPLGIPSSWRMNTRRETENPHDERILYANLIIRVRMLAHTTAISVVGFSTAEKV
jgi:hypothetical protein